MGWECSAVRGSHFESDLLGFHRSCVPSAALCSQQGWRRRQRSEPGRQRLPFPHTPALAALGIFQALLTALGVFQGCCSWSSGICKAEEMESAVFLIK